MCTIIAGVTLCLGVLGYSQSIENVAERRYNAMWGQIETNPQEFDILIGVEDCNLLGQTGWILRGDDFYRALIADCNQPHHIWPQGYLGDINKESSIEGYLILTQGR